MNLFQAKFQVLWTLKDLHDWIFSFYCCNELRSCYQGLEWGRKVGVSDWSIKMITNLSNKFSKIDESGPINGGGNNQTKSSYTEIFMRSIPTLLVWFIAIGISGHVHNLWIISIYKSFRHWIDTYVHNTIVDHVNSTSSFEGKGQQTAIIGRLCDMFFTLEFGTTGQFRRIENQETFPITTKLGQIIHFGTLLWFVSELF